MKQYYQCRLRRFYGGTVSEQIAWIPKRGAKVGATVELLPLKECWFVAEVFSHGIGEGMLKEHQANARKGFASTELERQDKRR